MPIESEDEYHEVERDDDPSVDEVADLLSVIDNYEEAFDLQIGLAVPDSEHEARLALVDAWVGIVRGAIRGLQAGYSVANAPDVLRLLLDVEGRLKRAAQLREDAERELLEWRDAGGISDEDARRFFLERWARDDASSESQSSAPTESEIFERKLRFEIARDAIRDIPRTASNAFALLPWVLTVTLPPTIGQYLARVARNFIDGRHIEGVIVARAVLDAAMRETIRDADAVAHSPKIQRQSEVTLLHRIKAAEATGLLSTEAARTAHAIRIKGNDAVHVNSPPTEEFVGGFDYVRGLAVVLGELYSQ